MKTIARNRTKFIAELATTHTDCKVYNRDAGALVPTDPAYAWTALQKNAHARLIESSDGSKYTVHVHSNLWYVLRPTAVDAPTVQPDATTPAEATPAVDRPQTPLVAIDLPDYLTAPVTRHAVLPMDTDRSARARRARAYVAQAADVLIAGGAQLAGYTASGHCVTEGAHLELRTFRRQDHADVVLDLALTHFNNRQNPVDHPRYAALRAARVAEAARWADLFRTAGWDVQEAHNTTPGRLAFILTPPTGP